MRNRLSQCADISDFNDVVSEIIDEFLEPLMFDTDYCIPLETEDDYENYNIDSDDNDIQFIWKNKVTKIIERATDRFGKIAYNYFPEDAEEYFELNLSNYVEN